MIMEFMAKGHPGIYVGWNGDKNKKNKKRTNIYWYCNLASLDYKMIASFYFSVHDSRFQTNQFWVSQRDWYFLLAIANLLSKVKTKHFLTHFQQNAPLLYPLKTSENRRFSDIYWGYRSGTLVENGLRWSPVILWPYTCYSSFT